MYFFLQFNHKNIQKNMNICLVKIHDCITKCVHWEHIAKKARKDDFHIEKYRILEYLKSYHCYIAIGNVCSLNMEKD